MFNEFPYTDLHNLNLDWFLNQFDNIKRILADLKKIVVKAPDATAATAGQAPIADGAGGWAWGDIEAGDSVPTEVRQAILALFQNGVYTRDDMSDEVAVIQSWATEITAISVSPTTLSISGSTPSTITAVTSPAGGAVTWSSSNTAVATVNGGVVTGISNGTCTITASCGGKTATCSVTVSGFATLTSITATYTQSGTVYDTDTLDSLKADLVVTATYSDSTTRTLSDSDYTLSGTLEAGTSTIVVSYGGETTTFTVEVTDPTVIQWMVEYQGNFTNSTPSNTRVTLISSDITFNPGDVVTATATTGYKIFAIPGYATHGDDSLNRTAIEVNKIYINAETSTGFLPSAGSLVVGISGLVKLSKGTWSSDGGSITHTYADTYTTSLTIGGLSFYVEKIDGSDITFAEAKAAIAIS